MCQSVYDILTREQWLILLCSHSIQFTQCTQLHPVIMNQSCAAPELLLMIYYATVQHVCIVSILNKLPYVQVHVSV